jgi:CheY-like chemotaxis protein
VTRRQRILLVEDSRTVRAALHEALSRVGLDANSAGDATEALDLLAQHGLGVDVADYQLPGMTGLGPTGGERVPDRSARLRRP